MVRNGWKLSEETKKKMSMSRTGKGNSFYGKSHTDDTKNKISNSKKGTVAWNKGVPCSKETKQNIKNSLIGIAKPNKTSFKKGFIPWNKGKKGLYSVERLKQMSDCKVGKMIREKNPNWKGGTTKLQFQIRHSFKYNEWRKEIFERDNYTCKNCNKNNVYLNVHHFIKFSALLKENNIKNIDDALSCNCLWDLNNGITLCKVCHQGIHKRTTTPKVLGWCVLLE
jgi:hypothetical protein